MLLVEGLPLLTQVALALWSLIAGLKRHVAIGMWEEWTVTTSSSSLSSSSWGLDHSPWSLTLDTDSQHSAYSPIWITRGVFTLILLLSWIFAGLKNPLMSLAALWVRPWSGLQTSLKKLSKESVCSRRKGREFFVFFFYLKKLSFIFRINPSSLFLHVCIFQCFMLLQVRKYMCRFPCLPRWSYSTVYAHTHILWAKNPRGNEFLLFSQ